MGLILRLLIDEKLIFESRNAGVLDILRDDQRIGMRTRICDARDEALRCIISHEQ